jgi:hypothetical protein
LKKGRCEKIKSLFFKGGLSTTEIGILLGNDWSFPLSIRVPLFGKEGQGEIFRVRYRPDNFLTASRGQGDFESPADKNPRSPLPKRN